MKTEIPNSPRFVDERRALLAAFADGIRPQPVVSPDEWGRENFMVPVGPRKGQRLDLSLTPYVVEPLSMLRVDSPWTQIAVKKSAQTGFSTLGMVWLFCLIATAPDDMMIVQPSLTAAKDFNSEKLDPAIKSTPAMMRRVRPQRSRSEDGSKTLEKKFPGGRLVLTGANSATDLSSKTVRFALADEVDRWPQDIDGQGDPMALLDARQIAFTRTGSHKKLVISTPTIKGASRIDKAYEAGDQRKWFMPCPHCTNWIDFQMSQLRGERIAPYHAHYIAQCCGEKIESWRQRSMVLAGEWRPTRPGPGHQPSYYINALASLLTSWDEAWENSLKAQGDPLAEKAFANLWAGESYEEHGTDLDVSKIAARCEDYPRNIVPPNVGRIVLVVDTQDTWFDWALYGFGPPPTSNAVEQWLIAAGRIDGDLTTEAPWRELEELGNKKWPHSGGLEFPADLKGIDTGGHHTQAVYRFAWRKPNWRALKGDGKRDALVLSTPSMVAAKNRFGRYLFKLPLFHVGVHDLKGWLSNALKAIESDRELPGRLHLTREIADEVYLEQMTAEVLIPREMRDGRVIREWKKIRERNEALDLAVYARGLAFGPRWNGLGVDRLTRAEWSEIIVARHAPTEQTADMFESVAARDARAAVADAAPPSALTPPPHRGRRVLSRGV